MITVDQNILLTIYQFTPYVTKLARKTVAITIHNIGLTVNDDVVVWHSIKVQQGRRTLERRLCGKFINIIFLDRTL